MQRLFVGLREGQLCAQRAKAHLKSKLAWRKEDSVAALPCGSIEYTFLVSPWSNNGAGEGRRRVLDEWLLVAQARRGPGHAQILNAWCVHRHSSCCTHASHPDIPHRHLPHAGVALAVGALAVWVGPVAVLHGTWGVKPSVDSGAWHMRACPNCMSWNTGVLHTPLHPAPSPGGCHDPWCRATASAWGWAKWRGRRCRLAR